MAVAHAAWPGAARADDQAVGDAAGALPGLVRVAAAGPLDTGFSLAGVLGYGYLGPVLSDEDAHHRGAMDLAASYRPARWLAIAARFNGRYDRHTGTGDQPDSGWVGDPRLAVRAVLPTGGALSVGAQLGVWMPGADAPSVEPSATTVDALGLATWAPGGPLSLTAQLGYRYDRSAESAPDADRLSPADRMALGVSQSSALLAGAGVHLALARTELVAEWSWDFLIGEEAPEVRRSPMRVGLGLRQPLGPVALLVTGELSLAEAGAPAPMEPLYPVEPRLAVMAGLTMHLGGGDRGDRLAVEGAVGQGQGEGAGDVAPPAPTTGSVEVAVTTAGASALEGAEVELVPAGGGATRTAVTDAGGRARFEDVPGGAARVTVRHPEHVAASREVAVEPGRASRAAFALERALPPGQLRGVVRAWNGKPLPARLTIQPTGTEVKADAHGEFELDLPPGEYTVEIEAPGYRSQTRSIAITEGEVVILNVDLRR